MGIRKRTVGLCCVASLLLVAGGCRRRAVSSHGWTWENPKPQGSGVTAVWASETSGFWAVGARGLLLRSEDGAVWRRAPVPTREDLTGVSGTRNPERVVLVGDRGTLLVSQDRGRSWVAPRLPVRERWTCAWGMDSGDVFVTGPRGLVLRSTDGARWERLSTGTAEDLFGLWGSGPDDLWAVGRNGVVLHGVDRGQRWMPSPSGVSQSLLAVSGTGPDDVWVVGRNGLVLTSGDQGQSWTPLSRAGVEDLHAVLLEGRRRPRAVGASGAIVWSDDGITLRAEPSGTQASLRALGRLRDITVAGGDGGWLLRRRGQGPWEARSEGLRMPLAHAWGTDPLHLWAVGPQGGLLRRAPDGSWAMVPTGLTGNLVGIHGTSAEDVLAVGFDGQTGWFQSAAGGVSARPSGTPDNLYGVWLGAGGFVVAVGIKGVIVTSDDRGAHWVVRRRADRSAPELSAVWGRSPDDLYAVGGQGTILHGTRRGAEWLPRSSENRSSLFDLWGSPTGELFAVGFDGAVVHSADGQRWATVPTGSHATLFGVAGTSAGDVWAVGMDGTVLHRSRPGGAFRAVPSPTREDLNSVWLERPGRPWVFGSGGAILRYR